LLYIRIIFRVSQRIHNLKGFLIFIIQLPIFLGNIPITTPVLVAISSVSWMFGNLLIYKLVLGYFGLIAICSSVATLLAIFRPSFFLNRKNITIRNHECDLLASFTYTIEKRGRFKKRDG